jgi:hypothetical protein
VIGHINASYDIFLHNSGRHGLTKDTDSRWDIQHSTRTCRFDGRIAFHLWLASLSSLLNHQSPVFSSGTSCVQPYRGHVFALLEKDGCLASRSRIPRDVGDKKSSRDGTVGFHLEEVDQAQTLLDMILCEMTPSSAKVSVQIDGEPEPPTSPRWASLPGMSATNWKRQVAGDAIFTHL